MAGILTSATFLERYGEQLQDVKTHAREAGRDPADVEAAIYLTLYIDDDAAKAEQRIDAFLSQYYGQRPDILKKRQACFGGPAEAAGEWLKGYADVGATYLVLRFAGDHDRHIETMAGLRADLGW